MTELRALGHGPMAPDREGLEVIKRDRWGRVEFHSPELCAVCPVTGQPDIYSVVLSLVGDRTLESKSLKLYLWSWAGTPIFAEHLADQIADDVHAVTGEEVHVHLTQNVRGGITTKVHAERFPAPGH